MSDLNMGHVGRLNAYILKYENPFTRQGRSGAARRILRYLTEHYGTSAAFAKAIASARTPRPRNVTATLEERAAILAAAPPNVRCWILLCSDLGIRSGTAAVLTPAEYDAGAGTLTFRTKYQNAQRLPVTRELRDLLRLSGDDPSMPIIAQMPTGKNKQHGHPRKPITGSDGMHKAYTRILKQVGIKRKLTLHDLRRTTARSVYGITKDLRVAQAFLGHSDLTSTMWYLQDNLVEVPRSVLEQAKLGIPESGEPDAQPEPNYPTPTETIQ